MSEYPLVVPRNTVYLHTEDSVLHPLADRYAVLREEPENKYPAKKKKKIPHLYTGLVASAAALPYS